MNLPKSSAGRALSSSLLVLSESDVRRCLPMAAAIEANRIALGALRRSGDGGAVVPTRIGLPYRSKAGGDADGKEKGGGGGAPPEDWTLFKPAAYHPTPSSTSSSSSVLNAGDGDDKDDSSGAASDSVLMGMKLVSIRAGNPSRGKPTVPATVLLLDAETGEVKAVLGATYLTAARTAAGSAVATELCTPAPTEEEGGMMNLVVFGAGLQAEMHVAAVRSVRDVGRISIVNRSAPRAEQLAEKIRRAGGEGGPSGAGTDVDVDVVLLGDDDGVESAVGEADVICTTTNSPTPLFRGEWVKPGCHLNGVGSYTPRMEEIDSTFISERCRVVADTLEALDVGDLRKVSAGSDNFVGLVGDVLCGDARIDSTTGSAGRLDCTMFKSVGTAIQDVVTAHAAFEAAQVLGVGTQVEM